MSSDINLLLLCLIILSTSITPAQNFSFIYNGFRSSNLILDGLASLTNNGLLQLTNYTTQRTGHAFYPNPITFKNSSNQSSVSFSTSYVFGILSEYQRLSGHGIAFFIAPNRSLPGALPSQHLGLFNGANDGNSSNRIFALELDTIQNTEVDDRDNNHLGIDINGLKSVKAAYAAYYDDHDNGKLKNLSLISGLAMQIWVDYDGVKKQIDVTIAPISIDKPSKPLFSLVTDLSTVFNEQMYVGFSSSTGSVFTSHYISGWSFKINGQAEKLDVSQLPELPRIKPHETSKFLTIGLPIISVILVLALFSGVAFMIKRRRKFAEVLEDWEVDYGPHRFKYKDLYIATKGFKDKELLGSGGFGRVYRGILPNSKLEIAVKRISHESRQGMREFIAEIVSIGRLRHRNLVQLLGYCRRKGELLLVYDYMPNGSLDKYLYDQPKVTLNWRQRFYVIKGVALGLNYLHEEWEQVVIHRDIKASNVLLDGELNGRLGDFGLARLYDHGKDPQTTHVVGTLGYLAPEHTRTGKATTSTDVFAFGAFLLEVACGRRPIEMRAAAEELILVDWVFGFWFRGQILDARDPNLGTDYVSDEVELVLKLGLMCSNSDPSARPSMRQVVQYLERNVPLPDFSGLGISSNGITFENREGFSNFNTTYSFSTDRLFTRSSSVAESLLSDGR